MNLLKQAISRISKIRKFIVTVKELEIDATGPEPSEMKLEVDTNSENGSSESDGDETLYKRIGGLKNLQVIIEKGFETIEQQDHEIAQFYIDRGIMLKMVAQKYAYFIACQIGMKKEWKGRSLGECHSMLNE